MARLTRVTLDVLKPHQPSIVDLAMKLGEQGPGWEVRVRVIEMDEKTETLELTVTGPDVDLNQVEESILGLGGSVHSIDEVVVSSGRDHG